MMEPSDVFVKPLENTVVKSYGEAFVAMAHDAENNIRACGFGPTPEAALEDLHTSLN